VTPPERDAAWPPVFADVRDRLEADLKRLYDRPDLTLEPRTCHRRPFSHVLHARASASGGPLPDVFVKRFTQKADLSVEAMRARVVHEHDVTARVHAHLADSSDLGAIRPLAVYPDALTIATEGAPGITLLDLLTRRAQWLPSSTTVRELASILETTGRWIARLQTLDQREGGVRFADLRAYLDLRLARLADAGRGGFAPEHRSAVLAHADRLGQQLTPADLRDVLVHADLAPGNVLVDGGRVIVLDFAMAHRGTRLQDLTRLHVQLDLLCAKPQFRRAVITQLQEALRHGYDPALRASHPLFRVQTLVHRVNNLSTVTLRPGPWPASLYDAHVRRLHLRWLARELGTPVAAPGRTA